MMVNRERVQEVKNGFPKGTRVRLVFMNDRYAPPSGMLGTVDHVDDMGTIHVRWDNGSGLGVVLGEDVCVKVEA